MRRQRLRQRRVRRQLLAKRRKPRQLQHQRQTADGAYNLNIRWVDQFHNGWALNASIARRLLRRHDRPDATNGGEGPIYPEW